MFCPNCGTQNESETTLCKNCGFKLSKVSAPKFKGTMMLNSDQSVQDLIEEHKKKLQGAAGANRASEPPRAPATLSPPRPSGTVAGMPAPPRGMEAPRGGPRRRMDGTMLGVAPQVGGISPPAPAPLAPAAPVTAGAPAAAPVAETAPMPAATPDASGRGSPERSADLASTVALPSPGSAVATARETAAQVSPGGTRPVPIQPEASPLAGRTTAPLPLQDNTESHAGEGAAFPESRTFPESRELAEKSAPSANGPVKPWQIVLIVLTCGLYGVVLLIQRRRTTGS